MRISIVLSWFAAAFLMTSCASNPPAQERRAVFGSAKTVAVVLAIGRQVHVDYIGFTVFNNVQKSLDIPEWGLDAKMLEETKRVFLRNYEVKSAEYWADLSNVVYAPAESRGLRADLGEHVLLPYVDRVLQKTPVDIVVFVLPSHNPALRIVSGRVGNTVNGVIVSPTITVFDARTKHEIYGTHTFDGCPSTNFNYKAADLKAELEKNQQMLERLWMSCYQKHLQSFAQRSGL